MTVFAVQVLPDGADFNPETYLTRLHQVSCCSSILASSLMLTQFMLLLNWLLHTAKHGHIHSVLQHTDLAGLRAGKRNLQDRSDDHQSQVKEMVSLLTHCVISLIQLATL